jgi:hypothetical protein
LDTFFVVYSYNGIKSNKKRTKCIICCELTLKTLYKVKEVSHKTYLLCDCIFRMGKSIETGDKLAPGAGGWGAGCKE